MLYWLSSYCTMTIMIIVYKIMVLLMAYCTCTALLFLPARRYASAGNRHSKVSVCPSVTRWYCVKTKKASDMISSPSGSPKTLVF